MCFFTRIMVRVRVKVRVRVRVRPLRMLCRTRRVLSTSGGTSEGVSTARGIKGVTRHWRARVYRTPI